MEFAFNGDMLLMARHIRMVTQIQLSEQSGIDQGRISRLEQHEVFPDQAEVDALVRALRFPPSFFFREGEYPHPAYRLPCGYHLTF